MTRHFPFKLQQCFILQPLSTQIILAAVTRAQVSSRLEGCSSRLPRVRAGYQVLCVLLQSDAGAKGGICSILHFHISKLITEEWLEDALGVGRCLFSPPTRFEKVSQLQSLLSSDFHFTLSTIICGRYTLLAALLLIFQGQEWIPLHSLEDHSCMLILPHSLGKYI